MSLGNLCEYSENERLMINAISPHWANVINKVYITPHRLYQILACECFCKNKTGPAVEALRKGLIALEECKIYRMTHEFDALLEFKNDEDLTIDFDGRL